MLRVAARNPRKTGQRQKALPLNVNFYRSVKIALLPFVADVCKAGMVSSNLVSRPGLLESLQKKIKLRLNTFDSTPHRVQRVLLPLKKLTAVTT